MTSLVVPGSQANLAAPQSPCNAPHGRKRAAESSLEHEQRLSKRFDLLNLGKPQQQQQTDNNTIIAQEPSLTSHSPDNSTTRLYIPVPGSTDGPLQRPPSSPIPTPDPLAFISPHSKRTRKPRPTSNTTLPSDTMEVEDTPHRVYIHNLDAELSDIESDEDTPIFLSDIEKHLAKIPKHVLVRPEPKPTEHNQVVLYAVPESLSVERERDSVRKAIVEARERIRERQGLPGLERGGAGGAGSGTQGAGEMVRMGVGDDGDAMDID
ncbi:hypothetical protein J1614_002742 [Plenodomus biglobosus]|nr:hypothetical protein J1614_002742 [Plenodomus biglobosus]